MGYPLTEVEINMQVKFFNDADSETAVGYKELLTRCVFFLRTGAYGEGASLINQGATVIAQLVAQPEVPNSLREKIGYSLQTLILMMEHRNWVAAADVIEYELNNLLDGCFLKL